MNWFKKIFFIGLYKYALIEAINRKNCGEKGLELSIRVFRYKLYQWKK